MHPYTAATTSNRNTIYRINFIAQTAVTHSNIIQMLVFHRLRIGLVIPSATKLFSRAFIRKGNSTTLSRKAPAFHFVTPPINLALILLKLLRRAMTNHTETLSHAPLKGYFSRLNKLLFILISVSHRNDLVVSLLIRLVFYACLTNLKTQFSLPHHLLQLCIHIMALILLDFFVMLAQTLNQLHIPKILSLPSLGLPLATPLLLLNHLNLYRLAR